MEEENYILKLTIDYLISKDLFELMYF